jgi:hypothetical protein
MTRSPKKGEKPIFFEISEDIYSSNLAVFANCDLNYVYEVLKKNRPDFAELIPTEEEEKTSKGLYSWRTNKNGNKLRILFLRKIDLDILAHEVFHATSHFLRDRGMELNNGSEEAFAHYYAWLFLKVFNGVTKK